MNIIDKYDLTNLETVGSTGSPLSHESFDSIYNQSFHAPMGIPLIQLSLNHLNYIYQ